MTGDGSSNLHAMEHECVSDATCQISDGYILLMIVSGELIALEAY